MKRALPWLCVLLLSAGPLAGCKEAEEDPDAAAKMAKDLEEAKTRLRNHQLEDAEKIFSRVLEKDPEQADALAGMGMVRWEQKKFEEAEGLLVKATAKKPDDADLFGILGSVYAQQDKHAEAAEAFGKAWKLDSENSDFGLGYGKHLKEIKKYEEAEKVLRDVADLDPMVRFVHTELADVLRETGRPDEALKMYMKAQNTYRSDRMARAGAALVYESKGEIDLALDEWSAYIRMDCCSDYSKNVARKKVMELEVPDEGDGAEGEDAAPAEPSDDAAEPSDDAAEPDDDGEAAAG